MITRGPASPWAEAVTPYTPADLVFLLVALLLAVTYLVGVTVGLARVAVYWRQWFAARASAVRAREQNRRVFDVPHSPGRVVRESAAALLATLVWPAVALFRRADERQG